MWWKQLENHLTIGSEYYVPAFLESAQKLLSTDWELQPLSQVCSLITDGLHGQTEYLDDGILFIMSESVKEGYLDLNSARCISAKMHNSLRRSKLKPGDVLVTKTGVYYGKSAVIPEDFPEANTIAHVARLVPKSNVNPYYLSFFLNSSLGQFQLRRRGIKATRPEIKLVEFQDILVPIIPHELQLVTQSIYEEAERKRRESQTLYAEAEALLLDELGLDAIDLSHETSYEASFSAAWGAGRLDAEYFQPKYEYLIEHIQNTGQGVRLADWLVKPIQRGMQPEYVEGGDIVVVNSQHVGKTHVELEDNRFTSSEVVRPGSRALVKPYDVLLNSTGYITIGRCQALLDDVSVVVDGHVSILEPKAGLDPIYLALFLNTLPGQMQTERNWTGSSGQIELRAEAISNYTIWKPDDALQLEIHRMVEESHQARREAKRLLEEAKQQVEQMILGEG